MWKPLLVIAKFWKITVTEVHVIIMTLIDHTDRADDDFIYSYLDKNYDKDINLIKIKYYLSELMNAGYIGISFRGAYYVKDKGRKYLVKKKHV